MANKRKNKLSEKRFNRMWEKHEFDLTVGLLKSGSIGKDKRSKGATKADRKRAKEKFKELVQAEMNKNEKATLKEAYTKVSRSRRVLTAAQISNQNIASYARKYGIRVNADGLRSNGDGTYSIISGPHMGHLLVMEGGTNPDDPSFILYLV